MKPLATRVSLTPEQRAADVDELRTKYAGLAGVEIHASRHRLRNHGVRVEVQMVVAVKREGA